MKREGSQKTGYSGLCFFVSDGPVKGSAGKSAATAYLFLSDFIKGTVSRLKQGCSVPQKI